MIFFFDNDSDIFNLDLFWQALKLAKSNGARQKLRKFRPNTKNFPGKDFLNMEEFLSRTPKRSCEIFKSLILDLGF